ncbi:MAG: leucine-rich repeat protein [Oscillospiraceae bacterium]|jgi:hypothetical protein|nr:leucine-rich repeat protein [Oscillospiraceae bacterium]
MKNNSVGSVALRLGKSALALLLCLSVLMGMGIGTLASGWDWDYVEAKPAPKTGYYVYNKVDYLHYDAKAKKLTVMPKDKSKKYATLSQAQLLGIHKTLVKAVVKEGIKTLHKDVLGGDYSTAPKLTSVSLPKSLTKIEAYAFAYCTALGSITIPAGVTSIGDSAFVHCTKLTSIKLPPKLKSISGSVFFYCTALKSVNFPASLTSIDSQAFLGTALTSVTLGANVKTLASSAFSQCAKLTTVNLSNTKITKLDYQTFSYSTALTKVLLPKNLKSIESGAFANCKKLSSITIPNSVTKIGSEAFANCSALKTVKLTTKLTALAEEAFANCKSLTAITLPATLTSIGRDAFRDNKKLTSIKIPANVTTIGASAFSGCASLKTVTFVAGSKLKTLGDGAYNYSTGVFEDCAKLTAITLPSGIKEIYSKTFQNAGLKTVKLPAKLVRIGSYAFSGCPITSISFPASVRKIGMNAFEGNRLQTVTLPPALEKVASYAFDQYGKPVMTTAILPEGLKSIGTHAFPGLQKLTIPQSLSPASLDDFPTPNKLYSPTPLTIYSPIGEAYDCEAILSLKMNKSQVTLAKGKTVQLSATLEGKAQTLAWASAQPSIAKVSETGLVTALTGGYAQIVATVPGTNYRVQCRIFVQVSPTSIKINGLPKELYLAAGDYGYVNPGTVEGITATVTPADSNVPVTWSWSTTNATMRNVNATSSENDYEYNDYDGYVDSFYKSGKRVVDADSPAKWTLEYPSKGKVIVSVQSGEAKARLEVPIKLLELKGPAANAEQKAQNTVGTIIPQSGRMVTKNGGYGGFYFGFSQGYFATVGKTLKMSVTGSPKEKITWKSSDTKIFTVDSAGKVSTKGAGVALLTAKVAHFTLSAQIRVDSSEDAKIRKLMNKYPSGYYWNKNTPTKAYPAVSAKPCVDHKKSTKTCKGQCAGFANLMQQEFKGKGATKQVTATTVVKAGDVLRYSNHSIFVYKVVKKGETLGVRWNDYTQKAEAVKADENYAFYGQCNWDLHCGIDWEHIQVLDADGTPTDKGYNGREFLKASSFRR